jgi:Dolichyl-phosphate-mannose-protein mannosyltransferase
MEFWTPSLIVLAAGFAMMMVFGFRHRWLLPVMLLAFFARFAMVLFNNYIYSLPQGGADAMVFERTAVGWAREGCSASFNNLDPTGSYLYSGVLAVIYGCVGVSDFAAQLLNTVAGTFSVAVLTAACNRMWGKKTAYKAGLLLAIFPALLIYSAVTLREAFILSLFSCAAYAVVRYSLSNRFRWLVVAIIFLLISAMFHGAMAFGVVGLVVAVMYRFMSMPTSNQNLALQRRLLVIFMAMMLFVASVLLLDKIFIPKVGNLGAVDTELVSNLVASRAQGNAAYLTGLSVGSSFDIVWQAPIRMAYVLFAPFLWNVNSSVHLFGLIDGTIYLMLSVVLIRHRKRILKNPAALMLLGVLLSLAFVYAFGTSNFGTAMRHRAKFYVAILIIVAPVLLQGRSRVGK